MTFFLFRNLGLYKHCCTWKRKNKFSLIYIQRIMWKVHTFAHHCIVYIVPRKQNKPVQRLRVCWSTPFPFLYSSFCAAPSKNSIRTREQKIVRYAQYLLRICDYVDYIVILTRNFPSYLYIPIDTLCILFLILFAFYCIEQKIYIHTDFCFSPYSPTASKTKCLTILALIYVHASFYPRRYLLFRAFWFFRFSRSDWKLLL